MHEVTNSITASARKASKRPAREPRDRSAVVHGATMSATAFSARNRGFLPSLHNHSNGVDFISKASELR